MPKSYLSFLMLLFAAVLILVLYDSCHKPKKQYEEIATVAGQDTIPRASFTVINRDSRQRVKKVWNPILQDSVVWKVWRNEIDAETLYVHTGVEEFDKLAKSSNDTLTLVRQRIAWDAHGYINEDNSVVVCYWPSASDFGDSAISFVDPRNLKVKLVNGRWEVESALPVRIKLKDGYLENNGDSIEMGFEYGDIANDFDDLVEKVKAKKRRGESWFVGTPLTPAQYDYFMRMIEKTPDSLGYVPPKKKSFPKIEWRVEKEWSPACQCSVVVKEWYDHGDSAVVLHYNSEMKEVPALEAKGHVRSVLDPRDYNTVQEWRVPEEIIADQKMLDSFFARLDSVLADTTKKP